MQFVTQIIGRHQRASTMSHSDRTFITNQDQQNLKERFQVLIKDTRFFDCLVGYFYTSGFHAVYKSLEKTEKIRILIGINTDRETYDLLKKSSDGVEQTLQSSHAETKQAYSELVEQEMADSEDTRSVEEGVTKFVEWIRCKKLKIKAYPSQNIHAKLYVMTFIEGDKDAGRVITGSSNFTKYGLIDNLEFNVELKNHGDYIFAKESFEQLWRDAVDVSEKYVQTIDNTWVSQKVTPYHLYLKFLYEYFKDDLSHSDDRSRDDQPEGFKDFEYQRQAVENAKKILQEYGGVFISDVVGLGKTYISAMLASKLSGKTLVIAPPRLIKESNPGSWPNVFSDFKESATFRSLGQLDKQLKLGVDKYSNVIIDEAHRFRTETTISYEKLAEICRGKKVILVTATPYNNTPGDILSLLRLFQNSKKSTIPNLPDLESFFNGLQKALKKLDRQKDREEYINTVKNNAREIRIKVLKYLMVRRTRKEIERFFKRDIKEQGLKFPKVERPKPLYYELNIEEDGIFNQTIELLANEFKYARYMPMLHYQGKVDQLEQQSQRNMGKFMKILLVKRLESSFFAFKRSIDRFLRSYEMFIKEYENGWVYVSKKHTNKIFELLENDDDEAVQKLIDAKKATKYDSRLFRDQLKIDLEHDLIVLKKIKRLWTNVTRDPKLSKFIEELSSKPVLKKNHLIIFTESKETAEYLFENINKTFPGKSLLFTGDSEESIADKVIDNFDAKSKRPKDDFKILVTTEVLSEGVNLHRANVVINYDIPWNPTRMIQRVGRINRADTPFDVIHTFNFFPTTQGNDEIKLKEAAEAKINAFLTLLGGDAELLTEGEPVGSHELFSRLMSKKALEGDDESEDSDLKYLHVIKDLREKDPDLFEKIKRLPPKARTAKRKDEAGGSLVTYFRRGKLQKFFISNRNKDGTELDFISAARFMESGPDEKRTAVSNFYTLLDRNKQAFIMSTTAELQVPPIKKGHDSAKKLLNILKATAKNAQQLTEAQELYLKTLVAKLYKGGLPKQTTKNTLKALNLLNQDLLNPLKVIATLQTNIPERLLQGHYAEQNHLMSRKREIILSMYLTRE